MTRSGPLTFGQQGYFIYNRIEEDEHRAQRWNLRWKWEIPKGVRLGTVLRAVDRLIARHESLRTTYGLSDDGSPEQIVWPAAEALAAWPPQTGEALPESFHTGFDVATEAPARFFVVTKNGRPSTVFGTAHHISLDGHATTILRSELTALIESAPGGLRTDNLVQSGRQPLDMATAQRLPKAAKKSRRALDYWAHVIRSVPCALDVPDVRGRATSFSITLNSGPALDAVLALRERANLSVPAAALTAFALQLRRHLGLARLAVLSPCANRFHQADRSVVGCLQQPAVIHVDMSDSPGFGDLASGVAFAVTTGARHASYDCYGWCELLDSHGYNGTFRVDNWLAFNYLSHTAPSTSGGGSQRYEWDQREIGGNDAQPFLAVYLLVEHLEDALSLTLTTNSHVFSLSTARLLLADIDNTLRVQSSAC